MPFVQAPDRTQLYSEEVGTGSAVIFVHEFAGAGGVVLRGGVRPLARTQEGDLAERDR
jgi:hypothetical protein